jgi:hypothetical protein
MRLTLKQVAARLDYSEKYFQNSWRKIVGLPQPHRHKLAGGGFSQPRWDADQIEAFAGQTQMAA